MKNIRLKILEWSFGNDRKKWHKDKRNWAHFVDDPDYDPKTPKMLAIELSLSSILGKDKMLSVTIPVQDIKAFLRAFEAQ